MFPPFSLPFIDLSNFDDVIAMLLIRQSDFCHTQKKLIPVKALFMHFRRQTRCIVLMDRIKSNHFCFLTIIYKIIS